MLAEPNSNPLYIKPVKRLDRLYSEISIDLMLKKCDYKWDDLMTRINDNLPLSIIHLGEKLRDVPVHPDSTGNTSKERVNIMPGLITLDE